MDYHTHWSPPVYHLPLGKSYGSYSTGFDVSIGSAAPLAGLATLKSDIAFAFNACGCVRMCTKSYNYCQTLPTAQCSTFPCKQHCLMKPAGSTTAYNFLVFHFLESPPIRQELLLELRGAEIIHVQLHLELDILQGRIKHEGSFPFQEQIQLHHTALSL